MECREMDNKSKYQYYLKKSQQQVLHNKLVTTKSLKCYKE